MHPNQPYDPTFYGSGRPPQEAAGRQLLEAAFCRGPLLSKFLSLECWNAKSHPFQVRHALSIMALVTGPTAAGHWLWGGPKGRGGAPTYRFQWTDAADGTKRTKLIPANRAVFDVVRGLHPRARLVSLVEECKDNCVNPYHYKEAPRRGEPDLKHLGPLPEVEREWQVDSILSAAGTIAEERGKWPLLPESSDYRAVRNAWYEQSGLPVPPAVDFPWRWD